MKTSLIPLCCWSYCFFKAASAWFYKFLILSLSFSSYSLSYSFSLCSFLLWVLNDFANSCSIFGSEKVKSPLSKDGTSLPLNLMFKASRKLSASEWNYSNSLLKVRPDLPVLFGISDSPVTLILASSTRSEALLSLTKLIFESRFSSILRALCVFFKFSYSCLFANSL